MVILQVSAGRHGRDRAQGQPGTTSDMSWAGRNADYLRSTGAGGSQSAGAGWVKVAVGASGRKRASNGTPACSGERQVKPWLPSPSPQPSSEPTARNPPTVATLNRALLPRPWRAALEHGCAACAGQRLTRERLEANEAPAPSGQRRPPQGHNSAALLPWRGPVGGLERGRPLALAETQQKQQQTQQGARVACRMRRVGWLDGSRTAG